MEKKFITKTELVKLIEGQKPLFIKFETDWCGVCKINQPMLESAIEKIKPTKTNFVYIDVDKETLWEEDGDTTFKVKIVPTYIAYKGGQELWRAQNFIPETKLKEIITMLEE